MPLKIMRFPIALNFQRFPERFGFDWREDAPRLRRGRHDAGHWRHVRHFGHAGYDLPHQGRNRDDGVSLPAWGARRGILAAGGPAGRPAGQTGLTPPLVEPWPTGEAPEAHC